MDSTSGTDGALARCPPDNARIAMARRLQPRKRSRFRHSRLRLPAFPRLRRHCPRCDLLLRTRRARRCVICSRQHRRPSCILVVRGGGSASAVAAAASATEHSKLMPWPRTMCTKRLYRRSRRSERSRGRAGFLGFGRPLRSPKQALRLRCSEYTANVSRRKLQNLMGIAPAQA